MSVNLINRKLHVDPLCCCCCKELESNNQCFFLCDSLSILWSHLGCCDFFQNKMFALPVDILISSL